MTDHKLSHQRPGDCVNGCGKPICPPSKVICRDCMDRISRTLEDMLARAEARERAAQKPLDLFDTEAA